MLAFPPMNHCWDLIHILIFFNWYMSVRVVTSFSSFSPVCGLRIFFLTVDVPHIVTPSAQSVTFGTDVAFSFAFSPFLFIIYNWYFIVNYFCFLVFVLVLVFPLNERLLFLLRFLFVVLFLFVFLCKILCKIWKKVFWDTY